MDAPRITVRRLALWALTVIAGMVVFGPVGEFFIELAREKGLYDQPSRRLAAVTGWVAGLVGSYPFGVMAGLVAGFAAGVWLDVLLKKREVAGVTVAPVAAAPAPLPLVAPPKPEPTVTTADLLVTREASQEKIAKLGALKQQLEDYWERYREAIPTLPRGGGFNPENHWNDMTLSLRMKLAPPLDPLNLELPDVTPRYLHMEAYINALPAARVDLFKRAYVNYLGLRQFITVQIEQAQKKANETERAIAALKGKAL